MSFAVPVRGSNSDGREARGLPSSCSTPPSHRPILELLSQVLDVPWWKGVVAVPRGRAPHRTRGSDLRPTAGRPHDLLPGDGHQKGNLAFVERGAKLLAV